MKSQLKSSRSRPEQTNKRISLEEYLSHSSPKSCWLLINGKVYDVTKMQHPGGRLILFRASKMDCTDCYYDSHKKHSNSMDKADEQLGDYYIGDIMEEEEEELIGQMGGGERQRLVGGEVRIRMTEREGESLGSPIGVSTHPIKTLTDLISHNPTLTFIILILILFSILLFLFN